MLLQVVVGAVVIDQQIRYDREVSTALEYFDDRRSTLRQCKRQYQLLVAHDSTIQYGIHMEAMRFVL